MAERAERQARLVEQKRADDAEQALQRAKKAEQVERQARLVEQNGPSLLNKRVNKRNRRK